MRFIKLTGWLLIIVAAFVFIYLYRLSYDSFIALVLKITHYNKPDKITGIITPGKYKIIQLLPLTGIIIGGIILLLRKFLSGILSEAGKYFRAAWFSFLSSIRSLNRTDTVILLLLLTINICIKTALAENFPITYDEAWTYINFTQKGFISSASYYPAPNNHIFYSLLTNFFSVIPLAHQMIVRLPAVLANGLFILLFYLFSRKKYGSGIALIITAIASFLYPVLYYGFIGRGYTFVLLFFLIIYHLTTKIFSSRNDLKTSEYLFLFSICSILGFYTMPSFLYPYATLYAAMGIWAAFNKRSILFVKLIYWGAFTAVDVVLLYMPVFIISGIKSVTSNSYVIPIPRAEVIKHLFSHFNDTYQFLFSFQYAFIIVFITCALALFNKSKQQLALLNLWLITFSLLIPILHSVIPFPRTWIYLTIPVIFSLGIILDMTRLSKTPLGVLYPVAILIAGGICWHSYTVLKNEEHFSIQEGDLCQYLLKNNIRSVSVSEPLTDAYILFAYSNAHRDIKCYVNNSEKDTAELYIYKKDKQVSLAPAIPVFSNDIVAVYTNRH